MTEDQLEQKFLSTPFSIHVEGVYTNSSFYTYCQESIGQSVSSLLTLSESR